MTYQPVRTRSSIRACAAALLVALAITWPTLASAQYFGKNKVQFDRFQFQVLTTQHFDIYYYPAEETAARMAGRMAERWYARLSKLLTHELTGRQPLILYASHPHFAQTNVVDSMIGEGTGGVTEGLRRRITLPLGATLAESDHVIGHELVHAFQYDILGPQVNAAPLWFIEGMAEYLSIGPRDPQTAMWLRDAAAEGKIPSVKDLDNPEYFPYRWGQAFWAYLSGRFGDQIVSTALHGLAEPGEQGAGSATDVIEAATGMKRADLTSAWHAAIREMPGIAETRALSRDAREAADGRIVIGGEKRATMNVGAALSPDGTRIAFLSEQELLSVDLYLADATTGRTIRKLISTAVDPHFQSLQFLMSAGTWNPNGRELAVAAVRESHPVLAIVDTEKGKISREIPFEALDEIFQPAWSPDGTRIAFAGQSGGFTDLYVHDVQAGKTDRLTNDAFADLQPAWSPDSASIAFVTDRFTTNAATLNYGRYGIATITPGSPEPRAVNLGLAGNATNPQWLPDGSAILFMSDATGRPEVYAFNRSTSRVSRVASAATGIAGITPLSPALSVASKSTKIAYSVFRDRGSDIHVQDLATMTDAAPSSGPDMAMLPPPSRSTSTVATLVADPSYGLVQSDTFTTGPDKGGLQLVDVGQQIGVASGGPFGTYAAGGIALTFTDVLGNRMLGTSFGVNGGFADISAQVIYVNRGSRWNWGVFGNRAPYLSGSAASGYATQNGQTVFVQQVDRLRQTYQEGGAFTAYPLSSATRVEFSGSLQHIGFDRELQTVVYNPVTGAVLSDDTTKIPTAGSLRLVGTSVALIRDTSISGPTGPLAGQRVHIDLMPTWGDLKLINLTADYRQYFMPRAIRPLTLAGRVMHVGRYGGSAEDTRLVPLYLGYPDFVRGYDVNSFDASDCPPTEQTCSSFDNLLGSRTLVGNFEVRAPLVGLFKGRMDYGRLPVDVFAFADTGIAWTANIRPSFAGGTRDFVTSVGGGLRMNLFGFAIGEMNIVRPINRPQRGWMFVFALKQGY